MVSRQVKSPKTVSLFMERTFTGKTANGIATASFEKKATMNLASSSAQSVGMRRANLIEDYALPKDQSGITSDSSRFIAPGIKTHRS